jgi:hypothetical protein
MEHQHEAEVHVEMDIADFSGKTVKRIDIQEIVGRVDSHRSGFAIVVSFIDGSTGTILIRAGEEAHIVVTPYRSPRMADYSIVEDDGIVPVPPTP